MLNQVQHDVIPQLRSAWRFAGTYVQRDGLRQLRSAWRFATTAFGMTVGRNHV